MKVVLNKCHGGFGLSKEGMINYCENKGIAVWVEDDKRFSSLGLWTAWIVPPADRVELKEGEAFYVMSQAERIEYNKKYSSQTIYDRDIERNDPALVQTVLELGELANGRHADLQIVEIPDDVEWEIEEYDGSEWVAEKHRTWY